MSSIEFGPVCDPVWCLWRPNLKCLLNCTPGLGVGQLAAGGGAQGALAAARDVPQRQQVAPGHQPQLHQEPRESLIICTVLSRLIIIG